MDIYQADGDGVGHSTLKSGRKQGMRTWGHLRVCPGEQGRRLGGTTEPRSPRTRNASPESGCVVTRGGRGAPQRSRGWGATGSARILEASPGLYGEWLEEVLLGEDYRDPGLRNAHAGPGDQLAWG